MAVFELQGPDGAIYEIDAPDERAAFSAFQRVQTPAQPAPAPQPQTQSGSETGALQASTLGARQGLTFNFGDEIMAALTTPIELGIGAWTGKDAGKGIMDRVGDAYSRGLEQERALVKKAEADQPVASTVGNIAGGMTTAGQLLKGGATLMRGASTPALIAGGAAEGALYGGASGLGQGEGAEDRLTKALVSGGIGAATGGAMGAVAGALAKRGAQASVPSIDEISAASKRAYQTADDAGLILKPEGLQGLSEKVKQDLAEFGYHPQLHPRVGVVLNELDRVAVEPLTLKGADIVRRIANNARMSTDPSEREIGRRIVGRVDDYLSNLTPDQVLAGDAKAGSSALKEARELYARSRKAQLIEDVMDAGKRAAEKSGSGSNVDNAIRQKADSLLNNRRKIAGFTAAEKEALRAVVKGGPVQNLARLIGKFAPTGVVSAALSGGLGYGLGGPLGLALPAIGAGAKVMADRATAANTRLVDALIRSGGKMPSPSLTDAQRLIAQALTAQIAQQSARSR